MIITSIQAALDERFAAIVGAFTERTGSKHPSVHCEVKFSTYQKRPEVSIYLSGNYATVMVHAYEAKGSVDDAMDLAIYRIAALRTIEDENADLGIEMAEAA